MYSINRDKWYSNISIEEVLRYAGVRDSGLCGQKIIDSGIMAVNEMGEIASPRNIYVEFPIEIIEDKCRIGDMRVSSNSLSNHLRGCDKVLLFAATLGSGADMLIRRYSEVKMSYAVMLQAAAAALIELYCDDVNNHLEEQYAEQSYYLRPRFSPGYGDFSIYHQPEIISMTDAYKRIGLTISNGVQMIPMKSVTAVIGLTKQKQSGRTGSCASGKCTGCPNFNCEFRRT